MTNIEARVAYLEKSVSTLLDGFLKLELHLNKLADGKPSVTTNNRRDSVGYVCKTCGEDMPEVPLRCPYCQSKWIEPKEEAEK